MIVGVSGACPQLDVASGRVRAFGASRRAWTTGLQRAWAAVLYAWPAALYLQSATGVPGQDLPIHIAFDESRRVVAPDGVRIHRVVGLESLVAWNLSPPRVRIEPNVLEQVHRAASETEVVRLLTDAVHGRLTTVARLRTALSERPKIRRRVGVSGLEYRDIEYDAYGLVVELDGRLAHDSWAASGRDADRDLDDHAAGRESVRLRWAQVFDYPCRTADRLAAVLRRRGWSGSPRRCGPDCAVDPKPT